MRPYLFIFLFASCLFSCVPHHKLLYFKDGKEKVSIQTFSLDTTSVYKIQSGDILNITISSTVASKTELLNEKFKENEGGPGNSSSANGYVVNKDGHIELPLVGKILVKELSLDQANDSIKSKLNEYLDYIFVKTSLVNFKITILGEVNAPGTKLIMDEKINIFQALGLAGDIAEVGNRTNVRILRKINNETKVITVDVSKTELIGSEYYYLFPNDIIYVEPLKAKSFRFNMTLVSLGLSIITLGFLVFRYTRN